MEVPWRIVIHDELVCPYCNSMSIELFDDKNKPKSYRQLLDLYPNKFELTQVFNWIVLDHFECTNCRKSFMIDWRQGYPVPFKGV